MKISDYFLKLAGIPIVRDPAESTRLGYVNAGTDPRIGGELGKILGSIQRDLSFKTDEVPIRTVERVGNISLATDVWSNGRVHYSIAIPKSSGRWFTLRLGWRYDPNWPGAIFDIVLKQDAEQSFI